jgi:hypothetical protein
MSMKARIGTAALASVALTSLVAAGPTLATRPAAGRVAKQRFTMTGRTVGGVDRPTRVIARGPIAGRGPVKVPATAGRVNRFTFELPRGSLVVVASEQRSSSRPDLRRCVDVETGHGRFHITGGSRAFSAAAGEGTYVRRTTITGSRDASGKCLGQSAPPKSIVTVTRMSGTARAH